MIHLDSLIELVNIEIKKGLSSLNYSVNGIVRQSEKNDEKINYDQKNNQIVFDTNQDIFIYHRLRDSDYTVIQAAGKKYKYRVNSKMELLCSAKSRSAQDYIIGRMSNIKDLEITGLDNDSTKIFNEETGVKVGDISQYVFKILYTLKYPTDKCDNCLDKC